MLVILVGQVHADTQSTQQFSDYNTCRDAGGSAFTVTLVLTVTKTFDANGNLVATSVNVDSTFQFPNLYAGGCEQIAFNDAFCQSHLCAATMCGSVGCGTASITVTNQGGESQTFNCKLVSTPNYYFCELKSSTFTKANTWYTASAVAQYNAGIAGGFYWNMPSGKVSVMVYAGLVLGGGGCTGSSCAYKT